MTKTAAEKLQIRPGNEVLLAGSTDELRALLEPLPENATSVDGIKQSTNGVAIIFANDRATLDKHLSEALPLVNGARATWITYPKGNRTDINRDSIWARAEDHGWTATANVSINETWSAVRIKPRPLKGDHWGQEITLHRY